MESCALAQLDNPSGSAVRWLEALGEIGLDTALRIHLGEAVRHSTPKSRLRESIGIASGIEVVRRRSMSQAEFCRTALFRLCSGHADEELVGCDKCQTGGNAEMNEVAARDFPKRNQILDSLEPEIKFVHFVLPWRVRTAFMLCLGCYINRPILNSYWKSPCLHAGGGKRLSGLDIEFPAVPGASDDFIIAVIDEFCSADGCRGSALRSLAQRSPAMRANVKQCIKAIAYSKHAYGQLADLGDFGPSGLDLLRATDKGFLSHC